MGFQPAEGKINDPDFWQQLDVKGNNPSVQPPATPQWGGVEGFAMKNPTADGWTTKDIETTLDGKFPKNLESGYKVIVSYATHLGNDAIPSNL